MTRPLAFEVETHGPAKDPWGNERIAAHFEGKLNRKDFGLTWNMPLETGGFSWARRCASAWTPRR